MDTHWVCWKAGCDSTSLYSDDPTMIFANELENGSVNRFVNGSVNGREIKCTQIVEIARCMCKTASN